jgi:hypothetical protein
LLSDSLPKPSFLPSKKILTDKCKEFIDCFTVQGER